MVWTAVMMGLEDVWIDAIASLAQRMAAIKADGQLAASYSDDASVKQLFHVRFSQNTASPPHEMGSSSPRKRSPPRSLFRALESRAANPRRESCIIC